MRCCEGQRSTAYLHSTSFLRMRERLNGSFHAAGAKEPSAEGKERLQKELTQTHAGDQLADTYSQHEQRNAAGDVIGVGQDKRDDQRVGYNGRDRAQEAVGPERVGAQGAEQRRKSAENDVGQRTSGQDIADSRASDPGSRRE